jgi:hypothetical protein
VFFKKTIISSAITFVIASSAFAGGQEPLQIPGFQDTPNYDCQYIKPKYCVSPGWYYNDIGMNEVVEKIDLFGDYSTPGPGVTSFSIGVYDSAISKPNFLFTHDALDFSLLNHLNKSNSFGLGNVTRHGNMTAGILSLSRMAIDIPTRPMIRANTLFFSVQNKSTPLEDWIDGYTALVNHADKPKVISSSMAVHSELTEPTLKASIVDLTELYDRNLPLRELIQENDDVLFVISASNGYRNSKFENGILHYELIDGDLKYRPLDNLMIVGAYNPTHKFTRYSNFGKSTDIAAPTSFIGISCDNNASSDNFLRGNVETWSPASTGNPVTYGGIGNNDSYLKAIPWGLVSETDSELLITEFRSKNIIGCSNERGTAAGTSASTPLVAGAAAILFHAADINGLDINNDPNDSRTKITPADIKNYLIDNNGGLITDRFISNFITEINPDGTKTKVPNPRPNALTDNDGDLYVTMARPIPRLNVNNALDALLADIPQGPVSTFTKISDPSQGDGFAEPIQIAELNDLNFILSDVPTGYAPPKGGYIYSQALFVPAGNACIVITKPDSMQTTIDSSIGVMLDTDSTATGGTCENPTQFAFQNDTTPTLSFLGLSTPIGISSTNGFYIPAYSLNLESSNTGDSIVYAVVIDILP